MNGTSDEVESGDEGGNGRFALRADWSTPRPDRLAPGHRLREEIVHRHALALAEGHPVYLDPVSGFTVFTAGFLAARGTCCDSGCRHCPFEPRR